MLINFSLVFRGRVDLFLPHHIAADRAIEAQAPPSDHGQEPSLPDKRLRRRGEMLVSRLERSAPLGRKNNGGWDGCIRC
jgi:hypothetical protein